MDHGFGTVICETTEIGDDCYLLDSVTLGASGIAGNPSGQRHPSIGHRVEIGAFARIFGCIHIGDDVFIGPHCVIKEDVPARSAITGCAPLFLIGILPIKFIKYLSKML